MKSAFITLALSALVVTSAEAALTDGLVAYWDYDGGQQEAPVDYTGTSTINWNGQWVSGTTYETTGGVSNSGYAVLSGASGFYTSNANFGTTTGFSVSFAVKGWDGNNIINFKDGDNGYALIKVRFNEFTVETTGAILGTSGSAVTSKGGTLSSNEWQRLTLTCDTDGALTMYVNGTQYTTDVTWSGTFSELQIASAPANGTWNTTASLDDVGFWNRALTAEEAMSLSASAPIPEPSTATLSLLALAGLAAHRRRK